MRIGINARYLYSPALRGLNRYTIALVRALEELQGISLVLFGESRVGIHADHRRRVRSDICEVDGGLTLLWEQWSVPRALRRQSIQVFHAPADGGLPILKACPYVLTFHGVPDRSLSAQLQIGALTGDLQNYLDTEPRTSVLPGPFQSLRNRLLRASYLRSADVVITVSEFSKVELTRYLGVRAEKIRVIHEAPDEEFCVPRTRPFLESVLRKYHLPSRFFLFVGGFDKRKNVSTLLRAFAALRQEHVDAGLVLVGVGGDLVQLKAESNSLGLEEGRAVFFLHQLPDSDLAALYRAAALFVTLSWHEGFCLPVVEAMACGAPILASHFGAIPEVLGGAGRLVDPRKLEDVIGSMRAIMSDETVQLEMKARSQARAAAFSWRKTAEQTLSVYRELSPECE